MIKKYVGKRSCAILGLGVSNMPLARQLCQDGVQLYIYDKSTPEQLGEDAMRLAEQGAQFFVADSEFENIRGDVIFRSPGIRPDKAGILAAARRGAQITSEIELLLELTRATTFAVTGSDGKTTTTTLTGRFLETMCADIGQGKTYVGGNIGTPLLCECENMTEQDFAVLELSSFQLMTLSDAPECAAITNVTPNHLDWHTDMREYADAKKNIVGERTRRLVTNADNECALDLARRILSERELELVLFSSRKSSYEQIFDGVACKGIALYVKDSHIVADDGEKVKKLLALEDIKVPGQHNIENYMCAIGLTLGYVSESVLARVAREFFGVEHRLELVRTLDGVDYYNSSIDSSPTRTAAALSALADRSIVLICGGYDKKIPYAPLAEAICRHGGVHTLVLTGATAEKIEAAVLEFKEESGLGANVNIKIEKDFGKAVRVARDSAKDGDAVLLSPASASFDAFKNFAQRGKVFKDTVRSFCED